MSDRPSELTEKQQRVLDYIESFIVEKSCSPTIREIGANFGITSPNGVISHLKALEKKGRITRSKDLHRGIVMAGKDTDLTIYEGQTIKLGPTTLVVQSIDEEKKEGLFSQFVLLSVKSPFTVIVEDPE